MQLVETLLPFVKSQDPTHSGVARGIEVFAQSEPSLASVESSTRRRRSLPLADVASVRVHRAWASCDDCFAGAVLDEWPFRYALETTQRIWQKMTELSDLKVTRSITIDAPANVLYESIANVTRVGEFSPQCKSARWDEGAGPQVGSWFTGYNERDGREWEMRCEVSVADPGRAFGWVVGGREEGNTSWSYTFSESGGSTTIEETWQILRLSERMQQMSGQDLDDMKVRTLSSIESTLAALKQKSET